MGKIRIQRYDVKRDVSPAEALCCPICEGKMMTFHFIVETEGIVTLTYTDTAAPLPQQDLSSTLCQLALWHM
jgi:hypothetical protein